MLNRSSLLRDCAPTAPASGERVSTGSQISRRALLGITGLSIGGAAFGSYLHSHAMSRLDLKVSWDRGRLAFLLLGIERWVIDPELFGGNPRLSVVRNSRNIFFELKGARYPGTDIVANLTCNIVKEQGIWNIQLFKEWGGFKGTANFVQWLLGSETLEAPVEFSENQQLDFNRVSFRLNGRTTARYQPDWTISFAASKIAGLEIDGQLIEPDTLSLRLLRKEDISLVRNPSNKRSILAFNRSENEWSLTPVGFKVPDKAKISFQKNAFDQISIESGETANGNLRSALLAESFSKEASATYHHFAHNVNAQTPPLPLTEVRYARSGTPGVDDDHILVAEFPSDFTLVKSKDLSVHIGGGPGSDRFEAYTSNQRLSRFSCCPSIKKIYAPLGGAISTFLDVPERARIAFLWDREDQTIDKKRGSITVDPESQNVETRIPLFDKEVVRPEDLLVLTLKFENLELLKVSGQPLKFVKRGAGESAITLVFPPQHIAEESFSDIKPYDPKRPVRYKASGSSRLVFVLSDEAISGLEYSLASVLRVCEKSELRLKLALPAPPAGLCSPTAPEQNVTAIEVPYRLILSPEADSSLRHSEVPVRSCFDDPVSGCSVSNSTFWTELWHTRLTKRSDSISAPELRAIWARDCDSNQAPIDPDFETTLSPQVRKEIHALTSYVGSGLIHSDLFLLSSLGASIKVLYQAPTGTPLDLEEWRHDSVIGRDKYVKVVQKCLLYPWKHRVSITTIFERVLVPDPSTNGKSLVAYILKKQFYIPRQKTVEYSEAAAPKRQMFPAVTFLNQDPVEVTLRSLDNLAQPPAPTAHAFWLMVRSSGAESHLRLQGVGTDHRGQGFGFEPAAICIFANQANNPAVLAKAQEAYRREIPVREIDTRGQSVAFAPTKDANNLNTVASSKRIKFDSLHVGNTYFPIVEQAEVQIPAIEQLRANGDSVQVKYNPVYLDTGFSSPLNTWEVFADVVSPLSLDFNGDFDTGTFLGPNIDIVALSRLTGIVGGRGSGTAAERERSIRVFQQGTFDPKLYFKSVQLLGKEIRQELETVVSDPSQLPHLFYQSSRDPDGQIRLEGGFEWNSKLSPNGIGVRPTLTFKAQKSKVPSTSPSATSSVKSLVSNYGINTPDVVVGFEKILYESKSNLPVTIQAVSLSHLVQLRNQLRFVEIFKSFLARAGQLEVHIYDGIIVLNASWRVSDINLGGLFALHGLSVALTISIGYLGTQFGFDLRVAKPDAPCVLTMGPFQGKAFFVLRMSMPPCLPSVYASFECSAGLCFGIDGVASLAVSVAMGIHYEVNTDYVFTLRGWLECHGSMDVLGVISVGVNFHADFTLIDSCRLECHVSLGVDIDCFLFSFHVDVPVSFSYEVCPHTAMVGLRASSPAQIPPSPSPQLSFTDQITKADWKRYCEAFA